MFRFVPKTVRAFSESLTDGTRWALANSVALCALSGQPSIERLWSDAAVSPDPRDVIPWRLTPRVTAYACANATRLKQFNRILTCRGLTPQDAGLRRSAVWGCNGGWPTGGLRSPDPGPNS